MCLSEFPPWQEKDTRYLERIYLRKHEVFLRQQNEAGTCYSYLPLRGGNMTPFGKKKSFV